MTPAVLHRPQASSEALCSVFFARWQDAGASRGLYEYRTSLLARDG